MTPNDDTKQVPTRARVSITERLVPAASFGLGAMSGIVGAVMTIRLFDRLRNAETAGMQAVLSAVGTIDTVVGLILGAAAILGLVGLSICAVRMFIPTKRASSPGIFYLIAGALGLVAPSIVAYMSYSLVTALKAPFGQDFAQLGATTAELAVVAIIAGTVAIVILLVFSFVPLSSRLGRKYSPVIFLLWIEIIVFFLASVFSRMSDLARPSIHIAF